MVSPFDILLFVNSLLRLHNTASAYPFG